MAITVLGIDLGKNSCSVAGFDETGRVVLRRRLTRDGVVRLGAKLPACTMAMEACCGAHHLGHVLREQGHEVRLMSPEYVQPYVKAQKNYERDAEAMAEAATRATMRFVELKSEAQLDAQILHRARTRLVEQRTALINQLRAVLLERGIVVAKGRQQLQRFLTEMLDPAIEPPSTLSPRTRLLIEDMRLEGGELDRRIAALTTEFVARAREDHAARRLVSIPGFGALNATALVAAIGTGETFRSGRDLAAWLGLVPRQATTGGKPRLHGITKRGNILPAHAPDPRGAGGSAVALGRPDPDRRVAAWPRRPCSQEQDRRGARWQVGQDRLGGTPLRRGLRGQGQPACGGLNEINRQDGPARRSTMSAGGGSEMALRLNRHPAILAQNMALDAVSFMRTGVCGTPSRTGHAPETGYVGADRSDHLAHAACRWGRPYVFVGEITCVEGAPQGAEPDSQIVLVPQAGAHLLQGDVDLSVDQSAQERLVWIELRAACPPLRTSGHRPGHRERGHPADRGPDADPKPRGRLPAGGRCSGFHDSLAQILAVGSSHLSLLLQSDQ